MYRGERFNSITHLAGAVLALAGLPLLITSSVTNGDGWMVISFTVYGVTLFALFLVSTLYHSLQGRAKRIFRILDYQAIYLLIAGTYTPFSLVLLRDAGGWWLFGAIWGMALCGIVLEALQRNGRRIVPIIIYLAMGWLILLLLEPLLSTLPRTGFYWLLAGGILYTVGVAFFALDHWLPWAHGIWHLFVLAGSISHYFTILLFL